MRDEIKRWDWDNCVDGLWDLEREKDIQKALRQSIKVCPSKFDYSFASKNSIEKWLEFVDENPSIVPSDIKEEVNELASELDDKLHEIKEEQDAFAMEEKAWRKREKQLYKFERRREEG